MLDSLSPEPSRRPFRLIRIYFRLPPEPGGMEAHIARLSDAQRQSGVEVVNVHNTGEATGASIRLLKHRDLLHVRPAVLRNALFYSAALSKASQLRGEGKPVVLHVHGDWSDFLFSKLLGFAIGAKVVVASLHAKVPSQRLALLYRFVLSHCDLVFSTGKRDQALLQTILGRIVYHLPSAPADMFFADVGSEEKNVDVITVANCQPVKRLELLVECAERRPNLRFAVYGDGPERERLVRDVALKGLQNIAFLGTRPGQEIALAMRKAKLFLLASDEEGTPTAALEAMASGLPVVLTPSNDYGWLVQNGVNGYVTSDWSTDELLSCIDAVLSAPEKSAEMGESNRVRVQEHTWAASGSRVTELMTAALRAKTNAEPLVDPRSQT